MHLSTAFDVIEIDNQPAVPSDGHRYRIMIHGLRFKWHATVIILVFTSPALQAQREKRAALTDPASLRLPTRLHRPTSDLESAVRQLQTAIQGNPDANRRARLRLKMAKIFEEQARRLSPRWTLTSKATPTQRKLAQGKMQERRAQAIEVAQLALDEAIGHNTKAEANWRLGLLNEWHEEYETAIEFYREILHCYADAQVESIVAGANRSSAANSIGECYAAIGNRERAVDTILQEISLARDEKHRGSALMRLLEYEPRVSLWRHRLRDAASRSLAQIAERTAFIVTLASAGEPSHDGEPIKVTFELRGRIDCRIECYRLDYRVWRYAEDDDVGVNANKGIDPAVSSIANSVVWQENGAVLKTQLLPNPIEVRSWITPPPSYHLSLWHPRFRSESWPPDSRCSESLYGFLESPRSVDAPARTSLLEGSTLNRQGDFLIHDLPPGHYFVSVPYIEYQPEIERGSALPGGRKQALTWCNPIEIALPDLPR